MASPLKSHKDRGVNAALRNARPINSKLCLLQQMGDSTELSSLLRKISELPTELITATMQYLSTERAHLKALKFTTLSLRKAASRILHSSLNLNCDEVTVIQLHELERMPFIPQVRELRLRNREYHHLKMLQIKPPAGYSVDGIPHQSYFLILKILSRMRELTKLIVVCQMYAISFVDDIIEIVSQLPALRSLHVHTVAPVCVVALKSAAVQFEFHTAEQVATDVYFPSLCALLIDSSLTIQAIHQQRTWTVEAMLYRGLLAGHINYLTSLKSMIIERFHSLADTWELVKTQRETLQNLQISMYDRGRGKVSSALAEIALPCLSALACWYADHGWTSRDDMTDDRALLLLSACTAPNLQALGIGELLLDHDSATIETFVSALTTRSPSLQGVLARHCQPPTAASDIAHENESQRRLRLNVAKAKSLFSGTQTKLLCLCEEDYDDYYAEGYEG